MTDNTEALPPLPEPQTIITDADVGSRAYTAWQMRDYARAALAQRQQVPGLEEAFRAAWKQEVGSVSNTAGRDVAFRVMCAALTAAPSAQPTADADGRCTRCGLAFEDPAELTHECPPGFTAAPSAQPATEPLLFRDLALELGVSVATLTQTIARRGLGNFSVNMAVPVTVAKAARDPAFGLVRDAAPSAQPRLTVRVQSFPESNGKRNWTALLVRVDPWGGLVGNCGGITIDRGEFWNRVAYEAERAKLLIGERDTEPDVLDYGDDITTPDQWAGEVRGGRPMRERKAAPRAQAECRVECDECPSVLGCLDKCMKAAPAEPTMCHRNPAPNASQPMVPTPGVEVTIAGAGAEVRMVECPGCGMEFADGALHNANLELHRLRKAAQAEPVVTLESALRAIAHLSLSNSPGREADARAMLAAAPALTAAPSAQAGPVASMVYFKRAGSAVEDKLPVIGDPYKQVDRALVTRVVPLYAAPPAAQAEPVAYVDHADGRVIWKGKRLPGGALLYAAPPAARAEPQEPLHITVLVDWLAVRYRAAGGKDGVTDLSAFAEEVMRWTESSHGIGKQEDA